MPFLSGSPPPKKIRGSASAKYIKTVLALQTDIIKEALSGTKGCSENSNWLLCCTGSFISFFYQIDISDMSRTRQVRQNYLYIVSRFCSDTTHWSTNNDVVFI